MWPLQPEQKEKEWPNVFKFKQLRVSQDDDRVFLWIKGHPDITRNIYIYNTLIQRARLPEGFLVSVEKLILILVQTGQYSRKLYV